MSYKSVVVTKRGGPEFLQVVENELRSVVQGEVLVKISACGVGRTDVAMRYWKYPSVPKIPFAPGYEIVGVVEAIGEKVTKVKVGDVVGALTIHGGYSEYLYLNQDTLVKVPDSLDPAEAAAIILNYTAALQMFKRLAQVKAGDRILVIGASGGVGSALLDLGKMENLVVYGTASAGKHESLSRFGAYLIDWKSDDFVQILQQKEPQGLDFVFDGVGGTYIKRGYQTLHRGGMLVNYSFNLKSFSCMMKSVIDILSGIPHGKRGKGYGITASYKGHRKAVLEDIATLFDLLKRGKIQPIISKRLPILEAAEANRLLESGEVAGNIVLMGKGFL